MDKTEEICTDSFDTLDNKTTTSWIWGNDFTL